MTPTRLRALAATGAGALALLASTVIVPLSDAPSATAAPGDVVLSEDFNGLFTIQGVDVV